MRLRAALAFLVSVSVSWAQTNGLEQAWKKVDEAVEKNLPQTAVETLVWIEKQALAQKRWDHAVKAIAGRMTLDAQVRGGKSGEIIPSLREAAGRAPDPMKPLLELLVAHHLWRYFNDNRWRISQRTRLEAGQGDDDIGTWSLQRILREIERQFQRALAYEPVLKQIPVEMYGALLEKGTAPDVYRPTLYDFIAHEMIAFYALGEQAGAQWEDAIELAADGPALDDVEAFRFIIPADAAQGSHVLRALRLFQDLLAFHAEDEDPSAYADADLNRLQFCRNQVTGEGRDERYAAALDRFAHKWKTHEVSSRATALRARLAYGQGNPGLAHMLAQNGAAGFPKSAGAAQCRNLIAEIEEPSVSFAAERVWCEPWPELEITYRNLKQAHFRAVPVTFEEMFASRNRYGYQSHEAGAALLKRKPARKWSVALPPAADYKQHVYRGAVPKDLRPGLYAVFAAPDDTFVKEGKPVAWGIFLVSKLALVVEQSENKVHGYVLTARDGEPVAGARVGIWRFDRKDKYKREQTVLTGEDGAFSVLGDQAGELLLHAEANGEAAQTWSPVWKGNARERNREPDAKVVFFTDRAIYRPGQTVQYKGVYFVADRQNGVYHAVDGKALTVVFRDPNGKPVAEQAVKSNDYGSFSGRFTAPRDRGTGRMSLSVDGLGSAAFRVEEYKRPKFDVTVAPPAADTRLGTLASVAGRAVSYSGVPVGGAKVAWRVVREVRFTGGWCGLGPDSAAQEIARGVTACDGNGEFSVSFFAKPDPKVPEKDEPVFTFRVTADVTDMTGETRTGESRAVLGYAAWQATVACDAWQTARIPVGLSVRVQTHNGEGVATEGELKVFAVKQPDRVTRGKLRNNAAWCGDSPSAVREDDPANLENWPDDRQIASETVTVGANGLATGSVPLKAGLYRVRFATRDPAGRPVTARQTVRVIDPGAKRMNIKTADFFEAETWRVEPGGTFRAVWGSGYGSATALVIVEQNGRELLRVRTEPGVTQQTVELPVTEAMRGGVLVRTLFVRENRLYANRRIVDVPWSSKRLALKWEHFTSKLEPGRQETWRAVIADAKGDKAVAEVVAALYDRSLDAFVRSAWMTSFEGSFNRCEMRSPLMLANGLVAFDPLFGAWSRPREPEAWEYRGWQWPGTFGSASYGVCDESRPRAVRQDGALTGAADLYSSAVPSPDAVGWALAKGRAGGAGAEEESGGLPLLETPAQRHAGFVPRRNLRETAFFLPHLVSDANGEVAMTFTMPEALTGWRLMAFAHDRELRGGYLEAEAVTAKDLMVEPNPPRFVREGDEVMFAVKISNRSGKPQKGRARLGFSDAASLQGADAQLANEAPDRAFALEPGGTTTLEWRIRVPDGQGFLTYKAAAVTDDLSDGEEGWLPVLSRRVAVRESLPLPVRGKQTKAFTLNSLTGSTDSKTIRHQSLTVQMVSQPAWYAVLALPYLMEYPHECCEQTFNRYYANALARHVASSDPKIRAVFDQWKGTDALKSPLEKSGEMKSVMLEETPWLCEAVSESAARRSVGLLFDDARLREESGSALKRLAEARISDGTWPWFPGGNRNDVITLYIVAGFGRLRQLGVPAEMGLALEAVPRLDAWLTEQYREILHRGSKGENHLTPTVAFTLYARSFFLKDREVGKADREAADYFTGQAKRYWQKVGRQSQAQLALALKRSGDAAVPSAILKAVRENATVDEELGMYWRDAELSWSWARAPIETQALMIEAFLEVAGDTDGAEACKVWLLKQKQTQDWKTTKATADAVYALLLRGGRLLGSDARVEVTLAGQPATPEKVEAGTGFFEKRYGPAEISAEMGNVTVTKRDQGVAWGAVHWQYLEDSANIRPHAGTPVSVRKRLFVREHTAQGPVLKAAQGLLPQGAELVTRIELRVDRDMEFVHLKDSRASCAEPVNVLSRYRWQDGLGYYESTRDTASHYFIDYLPKGVYVFESASRLQQKGVFLSGMAEIQCLYAPEFNSHSECVRLEVGQE